MLNCIRMLKKKQQLKILTYKLFYRNTPKHMMHQSQGKTEAVSLDSGEMTYRFNGRFSESVAVTSCSWVGEKLQRDLV